MSRRQLSRHSRPGSRVGLLGAALAALVLAGCAAPPPPKYFPDYDACAGKSANVYSMRSRLSDVDDCMRERGWKPSEGCQETSQQGTRQCSYER